MSTTEERINAQSPSSKPPVRQFHERPAAAPGIIQPVLVNKLSHLVIEALEGEVSRLKETSPDKTNPITASNHNAPFSFGTITCQAVADFLKASDKSDLSDQLLPVLKPQLKSYLIGDYPSNRHGTAHDHLITLSSWFLPSDIVFQSLKGLVVPLLVPPYDAPLKNVSVNAICNSLPLAQPLLDSVVKYSVIGVLSDPWYRTWVKGSILNNTRYYYDRNGGSINDVGSTESNSKRAAADDDDVECPHYE